MEASGPCQKRSRSVVEDTLKAACCSFLEQKWQEAESVTLESDISATEVAVDIFNLLHKLTAFSSS